MFRFYITWQNRTWQICKTSEAEAVKLWRERAGYFDKDGIQCKVPDDESPDKIKKE